MHRRFQVSHDKNQYMVDMKVEVLSGNTQEHLIKNVSGKFAGLGTDHYQQRNDSSRNMAGCM